MGEPCVAVNTFTLHIMYDELELEWWPFSYLELCIYFRLHIKHSKMFTK